MKVAVVVLQPAHAELEFVDLGGADHPSVAQHGLMRDGCIQRTHAGERGAAAGRVTRLVAVAVAKQKSSTVRWPANRRAPVLHCGLR